MILIVNIIFIVIIILVVPAQRYLDAVSRVDEFRCVGLKAAITTGLRVVKREKAIWMFACSALPAQEGLCPPG